MPGAEAEPLRVVERGDRLEHAVEVEQRLAHAHEHDVGQVLARRRRGAGRRGGPGRRSPRSRGRARSPARPSRRTGSRRRSPAWRRDAQRVPLARRRRGPGSASAPTRRAAPSDRRWSAFSVRPPSREPDLARPRRCRSGTPPPSSARRAAGSVRISVEGRLAAAPHGVEDLAGAVGGLAALREPGGELAGRQPAEARARVAGSRGGGRGPQPEERGHDGRSSVIAADAATAGWRSGRLAATAGASPRPTSGACPAA